MKNTILSALLTLSAAALAADYQEFNVDAFEAIHIGTGMHADVVCGDTDKVLIDASERILDGIRVNVRGGVLTIKRSHSISDWFSHHGDVYATISTTGPLNELVASTGSMLKVDSCAISSDSLDVRVSTGATARVAGRTETLDLRIGTGGTFNTGRYKDDLDVGHAFVKVSTGGEAGLCNSQNVRGKASTGAQIYVSKNADIDVRLGTGADVTRSGCW